MNNVNNKELLEYMQKIETDGITEDGTYITESLLNFVDLAGSEKISNYYQDKSQM